MDIYGCRHYTIDGLMVMTYKKNMLCSIRNICSTRLSCHLLLPPEHEKYMEEEVKDTLHEMYAKLYGDDNVHFPQNFHIRKILVIKVPNSVSCLGFPSGILTTRSPTCDNVRVGAVKY